MPKKVDPEVAVQTMLDGGFQPLENYPGAGERWLCKCTKCGFESHKRLGSVRSGSGCKNCSGFWVDPVAAKESMETTGFSPLEPYPGSDKPWLMKHLVCGAIGKHTYIQIKKAKGGGCLECGHKRGTKLRSTSSDKVIDILASLNLKLLNEFVNTKRTLNLKCLICGYEFSAPLANVRRTSGCLNCADRLMTDEKLNEVLASANVKALEPYRGSQTNWKCRCLGCGDIVFPRYANMQQGTGACKNCSSSGFNYQKSSYLYLVRNSTHKALKIGIANVVKKKANDRLKRLTNTGWEAVRVWNRSEGKSVEYVEKRLFDWIRNDLKLPQYMTKELMAFGGETETFSAELITEKEVVQQIENLFEAWVANETNNV
jgi:hypothetical protein